MASTTVAKQPQRYTDAVDQCHRWFDIDKEAKQFYVDEMNEVDKLKTNKHWDLLGPDGNPIRSPRQQAKRPNAVENITFALVDGMVSEFATLPDLIFFPVEPDDEQAAQVTTDLVKHIMDKNHLTEEYEKWRNNFFWHGTGIWEHPWDPTWVGGRGPNRWVGDVRWKSVHPRAIFPDARCGDDIHSGRRIHVAKYVTLEYIREKYPEYGDLAQSETVNQEYVTSSEDVGSDHTDEEGQVLLVNTWTIGRPPVLDKDEKDKGVGLHLVTWCGESNPTYLSHANYVYYSPGEDPKYPFTFRQFKIRDGSVWGYGAPFFVKQVQIIHNKNIETMVEGHNHAALGRGFYNEGALSATQAKSLMENGTIPGWMQAVLDINGIKIQPGQSMRASLGNEVYRGPRSMEIVLGRPDVAQGRNPGSVTAAAALDLLQRRAASRFVSVDLAITSAFEECGNYVARLVWQNYTEKRAYRIVGIDKAEDRFKLEKRGVFKIDDYRKVYDTETGMSMPMKSRTTIDPATMQEVLVEPGFDTVEGASLDDERYEVYSPELDVKCKTSQQMPSDRMVNIEWAMKLMQTNVIPLELFLTVVELGRFPAWREVKDKVAEWQQQQQMMQSGQQQPQPQTTPGELTDDEKAAIDAEVQAFIDSLPPDEMQRYALMSPEQQALYLEMALGQRTA